MARTKKQMNADAAIAVGVMGFIALSWISDQPRWMQIGAVASVVVGAVGWWSLLRMPTSCGVANVSKPTPCKQPVKGLMRACYRPDHQERKRKLIWARLFGRTGRGANQAMAPPYAPRTGASRRSPVHSRSRALPAPPPHADRDGYWVNGAAYHLTMLATAIIGTLVGVASLVADLLDKS